MLILRQATVRHSLPIGGDPLLRAGEAGEAADDADPLVALSRQPAYTAVDGLEVGHADGGVLLRLKDPVHQHHWKSRGDQGVEPLEIVHGAGHQQPSTSPAVSRRMLVSSRSIFSRVLAMMSW